MSHYQITIMRLGSSLSASTCLQSRSSQKVEQTKGLVVVQDVHDVLRPHVDLDLRLRVVHAQAPPDLVMQLVREVLVPASDENDCRGSIFGAAVP
eukprot:gene2225-1627_t